ncbi:MAG: ABC transporter substrate-binding protein [Myxococcota bacterium]|nr:ABC transporter substrate-binding protein [Myxococcota bacterium]
MPSPPTPRTLRVLAVVLLLAGLSGCTGRSFPPQDELVFALDSHPKNLDPRFAQDAFSDKIARLIFSPLLQRRSDGGVEEHLAERFEQIDELTYSVSLRRDARFHDGAPVRAEDVAGTYRSILDPANRSAKRVALKSIERIETPDERTVIFHLTQADATFPQVLAGIGIAPIRLLDEHKLDFVDHLLGSGPFRFVSQVADESVVLKRNDDWFGGQVGMETLRFKIVPDATVRVLEVMHGSADITQNDIPLHNIERLLHEDELRVVTGESSLVKYLAFNLEHPPLDDVRVRQAIALGIDRLPIIRYKLRGHGTPARSFLHPDSWAFDEASRSWDHDPARARALLDQAGFPDPGDGSPRLTLVYKTSTNTTAVAVAKILKRQLAAIGVEIELRTNDWGVFFKDIKQGNFDLYTLSGLGITDPSWYTYVVHSDSFPPNGANRPRYHNPQVDELLDLGKRTTQQAQRAEVYRAVQQILSEEIPILPLWYEHNVVISGQNVEGFLPTPHGDFRNLVQARKVGPR